jgi:uncharacterized protein with GYD domain
MTYDEAFLFLEPGAEPSRRPIGEATLLAWSPDAAGAAAVAKELADQGVRLIELYRGFGLADAAAVIEAVDGRVAVGVSSYGLQHSERKRRTATIYANATPAEITETHGPDASTTVISAPDAETAVTTARRLVDDGVELIEICGGEPLTTAALIDQAVDVPVALVTFPFESITGAAAYKAAYEEAAREQDRDRADDQAH